MGPVSVPPWRTGSTPSGWTPHSARCRSRGSRTPRWAAPASSEPSTPTCGSSGSWRSRSSCATAGVTGVVDARPSGLAVRVLVDGSWGFASRRRAHPRTGRVDGGAGRRRRPRAGAARQRAGRARRRAGARRRRVGLGLRGRPVRRADRRQGRAAHRLVRGACSRPTASTTSRRGSPQVRENKFYADLAGTSTTPAAGPHRSRAHRDDRRPRRRRVRDHALARPAGRPRLGVPHRHRLGLGRRAGRDARAAGREAGGPVGRAGPVRPGDRPVQPVADHPRVGRPRHRATTAPSATRPPTRAPPSPRSTSSARCATAHRSCTSPATARSRTAWPPSATTTRASPTSEWDLVRDGILVGYQLDRAMRRHGSAWPARNGCAFADSPRHVPIQRMANVSLQPAAPRPVDRRPDRRVERRHLRRRRQVLVDRHAALQLPVHRPALLPHPRTAGSPASSATSPTRPRPPTSGARIDGRRRPVDLACSAARSTAARPNPGRSPRSATAARRRCSAASTSSTPGGRQCR